MASTLSSPIHQGVPQPAVASPLQVPGTRRQVSHGPHLPRQLSVREMDPKPDQLMGGGSMDPEEAQGDS